MPDLPQSGNGPTRKPLIPPHIFWPGFVVAILLTSVAAAAITVVAALSDASFAIEENYYEKAVNWDETARQRERNAELAWQIEIDLGVDANMRGERELVLSLHSAEGTALDGATISSELFHHARRGDALDLSFEPLGDGRYRTDARVTRNGLWELRTLIERGPDRFTEIRTFQVEDE